MRGSAQGKGGCTDPNCDLGDGVIYGALLSIVHSYISIAILQSVTCPLQYQQDSRVGRIEMRLGGALAVAPLSPHRYLQSNRHGKAPCPG